LRFGARFARSQEEPGDAYREALLLVPRKRLGTHIGRKSLH